jgi:hypothetical protein
MISFKVRNLDKVQEFIKTVPRGAVKVALDALVVYLIGNEQHGLRHDAPYKYITRKAAYGQTFQSARQRRYVMAAIRSGQITPGKPNRTGDAARGYMYTETNGGYGRTIQNSDVGAYYTQSDTGQARQPALVGWRKISQNISDNISGAMRSAQAAVNAWLKQ